MFGPRNLNLKLQTPYQKPSSGSSFSIHRVAVAGFCKNRINTNVRKSVRNVQSSYIYRGTTSSGDERERAEREQREPREMGQYERTVQIRFPFHVEAWITHKSTQNTKHKRTHMIDNRQSNTGNQKHVIEKNVIQNTQWKPRNGKKQKCQQPE